MELIDEYIDYTGGVKRYSDRTLQIYRGILEDFAAFLDGTPLADGLCPSMIRSYEIHLLDGRKLSKRTVGLHISVLSGFSKYLTKRGVLASNPVRSVSRPKTDKLLPVFYREESMASYFQKTVLYGSEDAMVLLSGENAFKEYENILRRLIIRILYFTGIRRSELISLKFSSLDFSRELVTVRGKGDKQREIPLCADLIREISLYLQARKILGIKAREGDGRLLLTPKGGPLYPEYVDRAVKRELGIEESITARKSPHVLRHTIATELLNDGVQLNSIKEMLGHASLAATQVYTHNSIEKLKKTYTESHPLCQSSKKR
jgi:integrase/recombinase XerC